MNVIHIFIISSHMMFGQGLESLLRQETNFEIVGQEQDIDQAIEQIEELQPDVIILDSDNSTPPVATLFRASPGAKVISLSLQNNDLYAYQARQRAARGTEDLLEAIRENLHDIKTLAGGERKD